MKAKSFKGKIKLNQFTKEELDSRKLNALKGGCTCAMVCSDCSLMCNTNVAPSATSDANAGRWVSSVWDY
jgi:natural product precursor